MPTRFSTVAFIALAFLSAACGVQVRVGASPTATTLSATATLPVSATPPTSETLLPQLTPLTPTKAALPPVEGITSTQINVRAEPSTAATVLGIIPANTRVEITGKDPGESWWQINYPHEQEPDGKGWVTAQYVTAADRDQVPVIGGSEPGTNDGPSAIIQQQLNVRSGPGTGFTSLGTLNPQDVVRLTGKDTNGAWLQIDFPSGAGQDGKGWVNAAFVQAQGVDLSGLPIITEAGVIVGTGTPTAIPSTPTATVVPARDDNDSAANPLASVILELGGTQTFIYNGDLSAPRGDAEDWLAFRTYSPYVYVSLECQGNGSITIELIEGSSPPDTRIECGDATTRIAVKPGSSYLIQLQAAAATDELQYVNYLLTVRTNP